MPTKKSLGQHWLKDPDILKQIADQADISPGESVLEIGPGLGTLTSRLLKKTNNVVVVELDEDLAKKLPGQFPGKNLKVYNEDILDFDLTILPKNYKVVANVPYYITSKIIQKLMTSENPPKTIVLLIQEEVAERIVAKNDQMSILSLSVQIYAEASLGVEVPAHYFTPPPKVDSQVVVLARRNRPLIDPAEQKDFFKLVRIGFSAKRKKLSTNLSVGYGVNKKDAEKWLADCNIAQDVRAQQLTIDQWKELLHVLQVRN